MKSQKAVWQDEHLEQSTFTRMHGDKPSSPVIDFVKLLLTDGISPHKYNVLDIGCGKGRNSIWLSLQGFHVTGIDFVEEAINEAEKRANGLKNVVFKTVDLVLKWPFQDESFDAIIDCNTTICIPSAGRLNAINEAYRVLEPGGYYLFYGVGPTKFLDKAPGPEPHSALYPKTGKFEKQYTKKELLDEYSKFKCIQLKEKQSSDIIEGYEITYSMWIATFQKT